MKIHRFGVDRPVFTGVIFVALGLFGLVALRMLPIDLFPEIELPSVSVITIYPGASAEDVEEKVTKTIEDAISTIPDVEDITSISKEGLSAVTLAFEFETNLDEATNNIRDRMDLIRRRLPEDINQPTIFKFNMSMMPVLMLGVTSSEGDVQEQVELVKERIGDALKRISGVGSATVFNAAPRQIVVAVNRDELAARGVSLQQIEGALQANNLTMPAGNLEVGVQDYSIRVPGEYTSIEEVRNVIVGASRTGGLVYVRDVAEIHPGFDKVRNVVAMNGDDALMLMVSKQSGSNTVEVADRILEALPKLQEVLPPNMALTVMMDTADFVRLMIGHLSQAIYVAGLLVLLVVLLFLRRLRTSLIIALTIPASLVIAFAGLFAFDYTLNMISLMSLAIAIGMVVDNAIVVLENITRHREKGLPNKDAAAIGVKEVFAPVVASTITTIVIFAPLVFVSGLVGIMFGQLAFVIIVTLVASLVASLLLTPMLASKLLKKIQPDKPVEASSSGVLRVSERAFSSVERGYGRLLRALLRHRFITMGLLFVVFGASFVLVPLIGMDMMPKQDSGDVQINYEMQVGTRVDETARVARRIAAIIEREVPEKLTDFLRAGESQSGISVAFGGKQGTHVGMVGFKVTPVSERTRSTRDIAAVLRAEIKRIPGITSIDIKADSPMSALMTGGQKPVTVQVLGDDLEQLIATAREVGRIVGSIDGVQDVTVAIPDQKPELRVNLDRARAARLGLNAAMVGDSLRTAFYGKTVTKFRGYGDELDVFLRYRDEDKMTPADLSDMELTSLTGAQVKVKNVAQVVEASGPMEINRLNKQRMIVVGAQYSGRPLGEIVDELDTKLAAAALPPEVGLQYGGDVKQQQETSLDLLIMLLLAIILVYLVMAAQFESLVDPLVIMFSIPFAFTGVFLFLFLAGMPISLPAFLGLILLMGVVVNNAIVFVDYVELMRRRGRSLLDALTVTGERRLRPILMTAMTTMGGMIPLAVAGGEGHEMWQPMGVAVIGGLLFSTLTTLVLIPLMYSAFERFRRHREYTPRDANEMAGAVVVSATAAPASD